MTIEGFPIGQEMEVTYPPFKDHLIFSSGTERGWQPWMSPLRAEVDPNEVVASRLLLTSVQRTLVVRFGDMIGRLHVRDDHTLSWSLHSFTADRQPRAL